jgi:hypothetical protein
MGLSRGTGALQATLMLLTVVLAPSPCNAEMQGSLEVASPFFFAGRRSRWSVERCDENVVHLNPDRKHVGAGETSTARGHQVAGRWAPRRFLTESHQRKATAATVESTAASRRQQPCAACETGEAR